MVLFPYPKFSKKGSSPKFKFAKLQSDSTAFGDSMLVICDIRKIVSKFKFGSIEEVEYFKLLFGRSNKLFMH